MLNYNIYDNINDKEFLEIEKRLISIEKIMLDRLFLLGWKLTLPVEKNDALIIDFTIEDEFYMGNIGLLYVDEPGEAIFSFYVTKSYDELENRYFVKEFISEDESLSFFEQNIGLMLNKAINIYQLWDKNYIYENNINH